MAEEDTWDHESESDQSLYDEEDAYMEEPWTEDESYYGHDPGREELEPEPPDLTQDHSSEKRWYEDEEEEDEWGGSDAIEESWTEDDAFQGGYEEEPSRGEQNLNAPASKRSPTYQAPYKLKNKVTLDFNCVSTDELCFYEFSGSKRDYLQWEYNMDEYFKYYCIPSGERLTYCLDQLKGEAKRWWYQEENYRWYYKEPRISTWGQLKWIMRERYAPHSLAQLNKNAYLSKETSRGGANTNLVQTTTPKHAKHQGMYSVSNTPLELMSSKFKNRGKIVEKLPSKKITSSKELRHERVMTKRQGVQEKKTARVLDQKTTPNTVNTKRQLSQAEVNLEKSFQNLDKLCEKALHLIMSTRAEKGLGTKEGPDQAIRRDPKVKEKEEVVSAFSSEKETRQELCSPELKLQHQQLQDKSSNTLSILELICYKCQNRGHYAKECPTKKVKNLTSLELKENSVKESDISVASDINILNASMIHLSLSKDVETGLGMSKRHSLAIQDVDHEKSVLIPRALTDLTSRKLSIKAESLQNNTLPGTQVSETKNLIQYWNNFITSYSLKHFVFEFPMSSIMHLLFPLSVRNGTGAMEKIQQKGESTKIKDNNKCEKGVFTKTVTLLPKDVRNKPERGVISSLLIKEGLPAAPKFTKPIYQGKALISQNRMRTNLLSLDADYTVSRTKPFEEGGNGVNPRTSDEVIRQVAEPELHQTCHSSHLGPVQDICSLQGVYRGNPEELSSKLTCSRKLTHQRFTTNLNHVNSSSDRARTAFSKSVTSDHPVSEAAADPRAMIEALQPKDEDSEHETTWRSFSAHIEHASKLNQPKQSSYEEVIKLSNPVNFNLPESDVRVVIGGFPSNQEELRYKPTWSVNSIQFGSFENWIHAKTSSDVKVTIYLSPRIPDLPYLEPSAFERLQTYLWRPGEHIEHLEASKDVCSCTIIQRIRRILAHLNFPFPDVFTLGAFKEFAQQLFDSIKRLYFFYSCDLGKDLMHIDVPRHHTFTPKLSRLKHYPSYLIFG